MATSTAATISALAHHWGRDFRGRAYRQGPFFVVSIAPCACDESPQLDPPCVFEGRSLASFRDALRALARRIPPLHAL